MLVLSSNKKAISVKNDCSSVTLLLWLWYLDHGCRAFKGGGGGGGGGYRDSFF